MPTIFPQKLLASAVVSLLLLGCGGGSGDNDATPPIPEPEAESPAPTPTPTPAPTPGQEPDAEPPAFTRLHTDGTRWVNSEGQQVLLQGVNLGNWLLQEFWMMAQSSDAVNDQCTLESIFDQRFGFAERERLMDLFRDHWITERDWDHIQSFGFNTVRLPFIWNLIENEQQPMTLRDDAWQYLDAAIDAAEARGIYVILDLHGAAGAQGWEHHSGCAGENRYWDSTEFQGRTEWLWQQIARRYADRPAVAAYGVLNEPWGTTPENLVREAIELYDAIRTVDEDTIVVLPGHAAGLDAYPKPADAGLSNVAFEMHFYPGYFGWGQIGEQVHRDWLGCEGNQPDKGVCYWDAKLQSLDAPFLIGEFQPWAGLGDQLGATITRDTYAKYASLGWAATAWSYKIISQHGGQGDGTWGLVTNVPGTGLLAKADTWACAGWNGPLESACTSATPQFTPERDGENTYYFVVKAGACCGGELDITFDNLSITDTTNNTNTGEELLYNGDFSTASTTGSGDGWTRWYQSTQPTLDYNNLDAGAAPSGANGPVLRLSGNADSNGGIYQAITLNSEHRYQFSGVFRDNGSRDAWAEIYLVETQPLDGTDVLADSPFAPLDFNVASKAQIESLFRAFGSTDYTVQQTVREALSEGPE